MQKVKLLIFAHRGEAQAFFDHFDYKPIDFIFNGLFKSDNHYLLLTGEGLKESLEKTVATLTELRKEITEIVNIGIAGSLTPKLKINDIVWIRSSYAQAYEKLEFKSYTTNHHSSVDCISTNKRITSTEEKKELSHIADVVDRELWSVASASNLFKLPFLSLKLISDDLESEDFCKLVKEDAPKLSKIMLDEYLKFISQKRTIKEEKEISNFIEYFINHDYLYFTTSQQRKLDGLLKGFEVKQNISKDELIILTEKIVLNNKDSRSAKDISKILLAEFSELLNPLKTLINNKIKDALKPLTDSGVNASVDPELEREYVQISYQIKNERDLRKLILALEYFKFSKIKDIFSGKFDYDV